MKTQDIYNIVSKVSALDRNNFDDRCEIARLTVITKDMSYEDRLLTLKIRYGF